MLDRLYLNKAIRTLVNDYAVKNGVTFGKIAKRAGFTVQSFSNKITFHPVSSRVLDEDEAMRILVHGLDYKPSEAKEALAEIKITEALTNLDREQQGRIVQSIIGNNGTQIIGSNNHIGK